MVLWLMECYVVRFEEMARSVPSMVGAFTVYPACAYETPLTRVRH